MLACVLAIAYRWWRPAPGKALNQMAWEMSFSERGLPVPPEGPRGGYWGVRIGPKIADPTGQRLLGAAMAIEVADILRRETTLKESPG